MTDYDWDNTRREDPAIRMKVAEIILNRQIAMQNATDRLKEALDELKPLLFDCDDRIYTRCYNEIWRAYYRIESDTEFKAGIGSDIYIGNKAAGELGDYIVKNGLVSVPEEGK
jgi:hypothetical protein